eukprot:Skav230755  [mRNA]  locus=scaffold4515:49452:56607:+ [translate_table: standard]
MGICDLARFRWLLIAIVGPGLAHHGASLASLRETAAVSHSIPTESASWGSHWETKEEASVLACGQALVTPFHSLPQLSLCHQASSPNDDVDVRQLWKEQPIVGGDLQLLPSPLVGSMVAVSQEASQQEPTNQGEAEGQADREAPRSSRSSSARCEHGNPNGNHYFGQTALGDFDTPLQEHCSQVPKLSVDRETVSAEDHKTFEHLKGLRSMNIALPDNLVSLYQELETKIKPIEPPQISHSHLNRLSKLRHQVATAGKKVESLDQEWNGFARDMWEQIHSHSQMFLHHRQELLDAYKQKQSELQEAKKAIREASLELTDNKVEPAIKEEPPEVAEQLKAFQETLTQMSNDVINVEDDEMDQDLEHHGAPQEDAEEEEEDREGPGHRPSRPRPHTTFRAPRSPTKVAVQGLKAKTTKGPSIADAVEFCGHVPFPLPVPRPARRQPPTAKVSFAKTVDLVLHTPEAHSSAVATVPMNMFHGYCRTFWHMTGQCMDADRCLRVLRRFQVIPMPLTHGGSVSAMPVIPCVGRSWKSNSQEAVVDCAPLPVELPFWSQITGRCVELFPNRRHLYVETWFVMPHHHEVCIRSRRIRIRPDMTSPEFQASCRRVWFDVMDAVGDLQYSMVTPHPSTFRATCAHVLIGQHMLEQHRMVLLRCPTWPALAMHRAVLTRADDSVLDIMHTAQHDVARGLGSSSAYLKLVAANDWTLPIWATHDTPILLSGMYLEGDARRLDDGTDSDTEDDTTAGNPSEEEDAASLPLSTCPSVTTVPTFRLDIDEDLDDDSTSFMTHNTVWYHDLSSSSAMSLPDDPALAQEQDDIVTEDWDCIMNHVATAQQADGDADLTWIAVTYGIGLTPLGRRDCEFTPRHMHQLMSDLLALWHDHARYGQLEVYWVRPQPWLLLPAPYVVLIIEVKMPGHVPSPYSTVILTQETAEEEGIASPHLHAHRVTVPIMPSQLLYQLSLEQHCTPISVRDVDIRHRDRRCPLNQPIYVNPGEFWRIHVHRYPSEILDMSRHLHATEAMAIVVRAFLARAEPDAVMTFHCFFHGIAPTNQPLGTRQWLLHARDLWDPTWLRHARQLWPFDGVSVSIGFAFGQHNPSTDVADEGLDLHFVIDYSDDHRSVPVVFNQVIHTIHDRLTHQQYLATRVPPLADQDQLLAAIAQSPFWTFPDLEVVVTRDHRPVSRPLHPWHHSTVFDTNVVVETRRELLHLLFDTHGVDSYFMPSDEEADESSALQLQLRYQHVAPTSLKAVCLHFGSLLAQERLETSPRNEARHTLPSPLLRQDCDLTSLDSCLHRLQHHAWIGMNVSFDALPPLHPAAQWALASTPDAPTFGFRYHIFTDGSCGLDSATWAFVLLMEWRWNGVPFFFKVGYAGGWVTEDLGMCCTSALDAEATALIAAAEYLMSRHISPGLQVVVHFDSTAAGFGAVGFQKIPAFQGHQSDRQLQARIMMTLVQQKFASTEAVHIFAHDGHPWNEFADSVAGQIRRGWQPPIPSCLGTSGLLKHPLREWAWLNIAPCGELPSLSDVLQNHGLD